MKTQKLITTLAGVVLAQLLTLNANAKDIPKTDLDRVYKAGTQSVVPGPAINLNPGIYVVGDDDNTVWGTHYLIVDKYVNDDDKILAILIEQGHFDEGKHCIGRFYLGKKIKNGTSLMLSPIYIDINGNLAIQSEMSTTAQVLEVSVRNQAGDFRYPYLVQGHYGALGGHLLGMRAKSTQSPNFVPWPSNNIFSGASDRDNLIVTGSSVAIHNGRGLDRRFELLPLNGDLGKFAELVSTQLDTMGEDMVSETGVKKLAFFMKNTWNEEMFVVASPAGNIGQYEMNFYEQKHRGLMDFFFPGSQDTNGN